MSENDRIANDMGRVEKADNVFVPKEPFGFQPQPWHYDVNNIPHLCPVCCGKGLVPWDFYIIIPAGWHPTSGSDSNPQPETCRGCGGTGVIR